MSATPPRHRGRSKPARPAPRPGRRLGLIGRDLARAGGLGPRGPRFGIALTACLVAAALALVALRTDRLRLQYALGRAKEQRLELQDQRQQLVARLRRLRDPARLHQLARELELAPPRRSRVLAERGGAR